MTGPYIADVSFGKDSTAMLLRLIQEGRPIDEVRFHNTGMEFQAVYDVRDAVVRILEANGIPFVETRPRHPMWWDMFCRPVRHGGDVDHHGYGWCGGPCRWGTSSKRTELDKGAGITYVGIAADEPHRVKEDPRKVYPLVEWGMTEADCLAYCYDHGIYWAEEGVRLYDILDRVSCWCCRSKNYRELMAMREHLPRYYEMLEGMEAVLGQMKRKPLSEITSQAIIKLGEGQ